MAAAMCVLGLALAACGVPVSSSPHALSPNDRPPSLVTSTTAPPSDDVKLTIVLLGPNNQPVPVPRYAPQQQDRLSTALTDLLAGPGSGDPPSYSSAIPSSTKLMGVSPNPPANSGPPARGPVVVNLSADFLVTSVPELAVEQVVLTVDCYLGSTTAVAFEVEGSAQPVPTGNGTSVVRPVTAADYLGPNTPLSCGT